MKEGFQTIETLIESKQFDKLKNDFVSCKGISSPNDTAQFVEDLAGVFTFVVQYNDENSWMDIRKVCGYMTNTAKSSYERLRDVNSVSAAFDIAGSVALLFSYICPTGGFL